MNNGNDFEEYSEINDKNKEIKLLLVEDDDGQIQQIEDAVDDFNRKNYKLEQKVVIKLVSVRSYNEATTTLLKSDFDAAIIDLQLDKSAEKSEGVELIEEIIFKLRFPIFVRSGFPEKVRHLEQEHRFIKVFKKTDSIDDILIDILQIHNTGLITALGTRGKIEKYLNEIFWGRFSKGVHFWDEELVGNVEYERSLVRYCLTLLHEHLEFEDGGDDFVDYHPFEVFISPPIKKNLFFGDLLKDKDNHYIILSPACDMAQKKYEKIIIAQVEPLNSISKFLEYQKNYTGEVSQTKRDKAEKKIIEFLTNNYSDKYHYLPKYSNFPGGLINFQKLNSMSLQELEKMNRIATVSERFSKDIGARFSNYFARQGQPNIDKASLLKDFFTEKLSLD